MRRGGAATVTGRDLDLREVTDIVLAHTDNVALAPTHQPALVLRDSQVTLQVPVFRQHLIRHDEQVQHHIGAIFAVVLEHVGGQSQLGKLPGTVVAHPEILAKLGKDGVSEPLAQRQDSVLGLLFVELAVRIEILVAHGRQPEHDVN